MNNQQTIILGGGICGLSTAYFLASSGYKSTIIEKDHIGSHASAFAFGALDYPKPTSNNLKLTDLSLLGRKLHTNLSKILPDQTGINIGYRKRPSLTLLTKRTQYENFKQIFKNDEEFQLLNKKQTLTLEPRLNNKIFGSIYNKNRSDIVPLKLLNALQKSIENQEVSIINQKVSNLIIKNKSVDSVIVGNNEIKCDKLVIAMGPWSYKIYEWLGIKTPVSPIKGQILKLLSNSSELNYSINWDINYVDSKPDGLIWCGTTEEKSGFDESITENAKNKIFSDTINILPHLKDSKIVKQTACLRPVTSDGMPIIGLSNQLNNVYFATGAGRSGITLGPAIGKIISELIIEEKTGINIENFNPDRF